MGRRTIDEIKVVEVEKRKIPSKHYVYRLHVTWSDGSTNVIYRRYSRFFDFQSKIIEMFPEEAGTLDPAKRIIPLLPGKKFFGRSHIREVAEKRLGPISEYCQALLDLPEKISLCQELIEFFELEPDDLDPPKEDRVKASMKAHKISEPKPLEHYIAIADYKKQEKGEVTLKVDMLVEVIEKTESGWWFVNAEDEQGWVPRTCLVREDGVKENMITTFKSGEEEQYLCTEEFKPESHDEVAMERGAVVDVLEKNLHGWWRIRYNGREGYVPATYLIKSDAFRMNKKQNLKQKISAKIMSVGRHSVAGQSLGGQLLGGQSLGGPEIVRSLHEVSDLLKALLDLPEKISLCQELIEFFELEPDDLDPPKEDRVKASMKAHKISEPKPLEHYIAIADYKKQEKGEVTLKVDMLVEVIEKTESGWWFVNAEDEQGWVPRTCLVREDGVKENMITTFKSGEEEQYLCTEEFKPESHDEVAMERGAVVDVLEKNLHGWWRIRYNGREGYVPATYLIKSDAFRINKKQNLKQKISAKIMSVGRHSVGGQSLGGQLLGGQSLGGPEIVRSLHEVSDLLKVLEKAEAGWWYIELNEQEGWAPSSYIQEDVNNTSTNTETREPVSSVIEEEEESSPEPVRSSKCPGNEGEMSLFIGQTVSVLNRTEGWWYVQDGSKEGWVPALYVEEIASPSLSTQNNKISSPSETGNHAVFRACADFKAQNEGEISLQDGQEVTVIAGGMWAG